MVGIQSIMRGSAVLLLESVHHRVLLVLLVTTLTVAAPSPTAPLVKQVEHLIPAASLKTGIMTKFFELISINPIPGTPLPDGVPLN